MGRPVALPREARAGQVPAHQSTPIPNFFLAGSYTYQDYLDSMEGATRSGLMVADEVIARADGPDGLKAMTAINDNGYANTNTVTKVLTTTTKVNSVEETTKKKEKALFFASQ